MGGAERKEGYYYEAAYFKVKLKKPSFPVADGGRRQAQARGKGGSKQAGRQTEREREIHRQAGRSSTSQCSPFHERIDIESGLKQRTILLSSIMCGTFKGTCTCIPEIDNPIDQ